MMKEIGKFEDELGSLKRLHEHNYFKYDTNSVLFSTVAREHFRTVRQKERYGIYAIRRQKDDEVIYIGKSGTITNSGRFKGQNILGRLTNIRGKTPSNIWFYELFDEQGPLLIEYVFLPILKSPALVESLLLQSFLNEFRRLPIKNKSL